MDKFKRTLSLKKKKDVGVESSKPHQWQEDERKVREGCCSFHVKYLGCIEVFESRGIQVCEEAVKALKNRKSRSFWSRISLRKKKKDDSQQSKTGHHLAVLYVTGDALRVVDEISKGLIVDQTIEKVSFCAPDRNHDRGFAYICRDGTTRRWMCHGFLAIKESGERLSHAVGCAFAICLEKKQQREKEKVSVTYNDNGTSFTRLGSFRQATVTERLADPQSAIIAEPVPSKPTSNPFAVQRPHAPADILERQGSFRSFQKLADSSPFKRNISLRINELPSNLDRQKQFVGLDGPQMNNYKIIGTIIEAEEQDPFCPTCPVEAFASLKISNTSGNIPSSLGNQSIIQTTNNPCDQSSPNKDLHRPITQNNPWEEIETCYNASEADSWLNATANKIDNFACASGNNTYSTRSHLYNGMDASKTDLGPRVHQALYPLQPVVSGYVGNAPISSLTYGNQPYPGTYQVRGHIPQITTAFSGGSFHHETCFHQETASIPQHLVDTTPDQRSTIFLARPQNAEPALDSYKPANVWPVVTNPFKEGNDVSSFQLKI